MMYFKFRVLPTLALAVLTLTSATAGEQIPPPGVCISMGLKSIPIILIRYLYPPQLFCCPPYGPEGLPLNRQQVGPFDIFC